MKFLPIFLLLTFSCCDHTAWNRLPNPADVMECIDGSVGDKNASVYFDTCMYNRGYFTACTKCREGSWWLSKGWYTFVCAETKF